MQVHLLVAHLKGVLSLLGQKKILGSMVIHLYVHLLFFSGHCLDLPPLPFCIMLSQTYLKRLSAAHYILGWTNIRQFFPENIADEIVAWTHEILSCSYLCDFVICVLVYMIKPRNCQIGFPLVVQRRWGRRKWYTTWWRLLACVNLHGLATLISLLKYIILSVVIVLLHILFYSLYGWYFLWVVFSIEVLKKIVIMK